MANGAVTGNIFELSSLKGGLDDTSPYMTMDPDVCVAAENIEFIKSTLGERRKGCEALDDLPSFVADSSIDACTWMYRHLPTNDQGDAELWALGQSFSVNLATIERRDINSWSIVSPDDDFITFAGKGHRLAGQTLHGKLFIAGKSAEDRLHVWDGTHLRRVGVAQPTSAPSASNDFAAGTFSTTRYYRIRFIIKDASNIIQARSEFSDTLAFTPSGTQVGVNVSIASIAGVETRVTHWELEASMDNVNFYRITTQLLATTTYLDTEPAASGYVSFPLSAVAGTFTLIPSGKLLSVDNDRLLIGGSWEDDTKASRITWTPVYSDPAGASDERIDLNNDPFIDLDGFEGGELTCLSRNVNGYIYAFKRSHIYKLIRTGQLVGSYEAIPLTKDRGALPGSLVEAIDQSGQPALYFIDPAVGPMRLGANGLQWCGRDIQTLWKRVNVNATVPCHGVYYNDNRQVHFWLAIDGADRPNYKIVLHVNEVRDTDEGARRGWVTVTKNSRIATAECSLMFSSNVSDSGTARNYTMVPLIGKQKWTVSVSTITDIVQRCDIGGTDAFTTGDTEATYRGVVTSRPFALAGLLSQFEVLTGALLMKGEDTPDGTVFVKLIKDFGVEDKQVSATFFTPGTESHVLAHLDDLQLAELYALQISMGDLDDSVTAPTTWELDMLHIKLTGGNSA